MKTAANNSATSATLRETAPIDYLALLTEHIRSALKQPGGATETRSDAFYGGVLGDPLVRVWIAESCRSHGVICEFAQWLGNWSLRLRKR